MKYVKVKQGTKLGFAICKMGGGSKPFISKQQIQTRKSNTTGRYLSNNSMWTYVIQN